MEGIKRHKIGDRIGRLPYECWGCILLFLDSKNDLVSILLTVKGLNEFLKTQLSYFTRNITFSMRSLPPKIITVSHVTNLKISSDSSLKYALREFGDTNFTYVYNVYGRDSSDDENEKEVDEEEAIEERKKKFEGYKGIKTFLQFLEILFEKFPNLVSLNIEMLYHYFNKSNRYRGNGKELFEDCCKSEDWNCWRELTEFSLSSSNFAIDTLPLRILDLTISSFQLTMTDCLSFVNVEELSLSSFGGILTEFGEGKAPYCCSFYHFKDLKINFQVCFPRLRSLFLCGFLLQTPLGEAVTNNLENIELDYMKITDRRILEFSYPKLKILRLCDESDKSIHLGLFTKFSNPSLEQISMKSTGCFGQIFRREDYEYRQHFVYRPLGGKEFPIPLAEDLFRTDRSKIFPILRHIIIDNRPNICGWGISIAGGQSAVALTLGNLPNLETLKIYQIVSPIVILQTPNLRILEAHMCMFDVYIDSCDCRSSESFPIDIPFVEDGKKLERIFFESSITGTGLENNLSYFTNLRSCIIKKSVGHYSYNNNIAKEDIKLINFLHLEEFCVDISQEITVIKNCPKLRKLRFNSYEESENKFLIEEVPSLEYLSLGKVGHSRCQEIIEHISLKSKLKNLSEFVVEYCYCQQDGGGINKFDASSIISLQKVSISRFISAQFCGSQFSRKMYENLVELNIGYGVGMVRVNGLNRLKILKIRSVKMIHLGKLPNLQFFKWDRPGKDLSSYDEGKCELYELRIMSLLSNNPLEVDLIETNFKDPTDLGFSTEIGRVYSICIDNCDISILRISQSVYESKQFDISNSNIRELEIKFCRQRQSRSRYTYSGTLSGCGREIKLDDHPFSLDHQRFGSIWKLIISYKSKKTYKPFFFDKIDLYGMKNLKEIEINEIGHFQNNPFVKKILIMSKNDFLLERVRVKCVMCEKGDSRDMSLKEYIETLKKEKKMLIDVVETQKIT